MQAKAATATPSPYFVGSFAPIECETELTELRVLSGEVPKDVFGAYVRNGPNARFDPPGRYHWFDGDGMLHGLYLEDGKARYQSKWVQTAGFAQETQAGHGLWTGLLESTKDNPNHYYKDTANTDVIYHNGSLVALWYIGGIPYRVNASSLETMGPDSFGRDKPLRISAHAKATHDGKILFFEYGPTPPFMRYGEVDPSGKLVHRIDVPLPGPRLPHDMAASETHAVLMDLPMVFRPEALAKRRWLVEFDRDLRSRFAVIPRGGAAEDVRWFEAEPCYIYHTVHCWDEGDEVVMVACRVAEPTPEPDPRDGEWARMMANLRVKATLHEWRFNLKTGATRERELDDRHCEFPSVHSDHVGKRGRYSYHMSFAPTSTVRFDGIVKYDLETGASTHVPFGPGRFGSESPFAPRIGATSEDDGYIVSFVHDENADRSEVLIYDAKTMDATPVAVLEAPRRIPIGFHACWAEGVSAGG